MPFSRGNRRKILATQVGRKTRRKGVLPQPEGLAIVEEEGSNQ